MKSSDNAAEQLMRVMVGRFLQGWSDKQIVEDLVPRLGLSGERVAELVSAARRGYEDGRDQAIHKTVSRGVDAAFSRYRARHPNRRLGLRIPALLIGALLVLISIGGFLSGDAIPASIVAIVGLAIGAVFFLLSPSAESSTNG